MPKRKNVKRKKFTSPGGINITARSYKKLVAEAANARRRIARFNSKYGDQGYEMVDPAAYTVANLLERLRAGETVRSVLRDVRNIGYESLKQRKPAQIKTPSGYTLTPTETVQLITAMNQANRNIGAAQKKYKDFIDVLPPKFTTEDVAASIIGPEGVKKQLERLAVFTPEKLEVTAIFETGEAGTQAEYEYYIKPLQEENERRRQAREDVSRLSNLSKFVEGEETDIEEDTVGFFQTQAMTDIKRIDISKIPDMTELKRRSTTWSDPARVARANLFVENYTNALNDLEALIRQSGFINETIENQIDFIRTVLGKLYGNEALITHISRHIPNINIEILSPTAQQAGWYGEVPFDEIYNAFAELDDEYL